MVIGTGPAEDTCTVKVIGHTQEVTVYGMAENGISVVMDGIGKEEDGAKRIFVEIVPQPGA
jgi:hypothetical protein